MTLGNKQLALKKCSHKVFSFSTSLMLTSTLEWTETATLNLTATNASVKFHNWPLWKRADLQRFLYQSGIMPTKVLRFKPSESIWEYSCWTTAERPTLDIVFQALQNCKQRGTVWRIRDCCCYLEVTLVCVLHYNRECSWKLVLSSTVCVIYFTWLIQMLGMQELHQLTYHFPHENNCD